MGGNYSGSKQMLRVTLCIETETKILLGLDKIGVHPQLRPQSLSKDLAI